MARLEFRSRLTPKKQYVYDLGRQALCDRNPLRSDSLFFSRICDVIRTDFPPYQAEEKQ